MLIEQQPNGMIGPGPLLTVEDIAADAGGQKGDLPDSNGEQGRPLRRRRAATPL
jgi:hypothetical protein